MKIKLINNYHGTECYVIPRDNLLSARQIKSAKKKLCPYKDCQCSNPLGTRGSGYAVLFYPNGTAQLLGDKNND